MKHAELLCVWTADKQSKGSIFIKDAYLKRFIWCFPAKDTSELAQWHNIIVCLEFLGHTVSAALWPVLKVITLHFQISLQQLGEPIPDETPFRKRVKGSHGQLAPLNTTLTCWHSMNWGTKAYWHAAVLLSSTGVAMGTNVSKSLYIQ